MKSVLMVEHKVRSISNIMSCGEKGLLSGHGGDGEDRRPSGADSVVPVHTIQVM